MKPAVHGTFKLERDYDAAPQVVFAAWANVETKARWFIGPAEWTLVARELDFRVGGRELLKGMHAGVGMVAFTARYHQIVADRRIVLAYDMHIDERHISTSLQTVELEAFAGGTRLTLTEQDVFFDGADGAASRKRGTDTHLVLLASALRGN